VLYDWRCQLGAPSCLGKSFELGPDLRQGDGFVDERLSVLIHAVWLRDIIATVCSLTLLNMNTQINGDARPDTFIVVVVVGVKNLKT
jgi:hypothetical protein